MAGSPLASSAEIFRCQTGGWLLAECCVRELRRTFQPRVPQRCSAAFSISNESDEGLTQGHSHDTGDRAAPNWTGQIGAKAEQHFVRKWFTWTGKKGWRPRLRCLAVCTWADILWGYHCHLLPFFLWGHWQDRRLQDRNIADLWCGGTGHKPHARQQHSFLRPWSMCINSSTPHWQVASWSGHGLPTDELCVQILGPTGIYVIIYLSIYLPTYLSTYLPIHLPIYLHFCFL